MYKNNFEGALISFNDIRKKCAVTFEFIFPGLKDLHGIVLEYDDLQSYCYKVWYLGDILIHRITELVARE